MSASRARLLLVDDDEPFRDSTRAALVACGYVCIATPDVDHASQLLASETFDVVISDIRMKGNVELEFVKRLAALSDAPPVVLVTGFPSTGTAVEALDLDVVAYLVKPFDIGDLSARIDKALTRRRARGFLEKARGRLEVVLEDLAEVSEPIVDSPEGGVKGCFDRAKTERRGEGAPVGFSDAGLTTREEELVSYLVEGYRVSTIADRLYISRHTVRRHLKSIFLKLEVSSQAELLETLKPWPESQPRSSRAASAVHTASE